MRGGGGGTIACCSDNPLCRSVDKLAALLVTPHIYFWVRPLQVTSQAPVCTSGAKGLGKSAV